MQKIHDARFWVLYDDPTVGRETDFWPLLGRPMPSAVHVEIVIPSRIVEITIVAIDNGDP